MAATSIGTRAPWLVLSLLGLVGCRDEPKTLDRFGALPQFALQDQRGRAVTDADLRGRVLVVDFIFTSCPDVCPLLTQQLAGVRKKLPSGAELAFVSFSVDPEHDTPERLRAFAAAHGADHADWYFLTGPLDELRRVVTTGFKQAMQAEPVEPGKPRNVLHGTHFVLVDQRGEIRGFFRNDEEGTAQLREAASSLLQQRGAMTQSDWMRCSVAASPELDRRAIPASRRCLAAPARPYPLRDDRASPAAAAAGRAS